MHVPGASRCPVIQFRFIKQIASLSIAEGETATHMLQGLYGSKNVVLLSGEWPEGTKNLNSCGTPTTTATEGEK